MASTSRHVLLSALSGLAWGCLGAWIAAGSAPRAIWWGGLIASPAIGVWIGSATPRWARLSAPRRAWVALLSLYAAAALFGLAVGVGDWLTGDRASRSPLAVVTQSLMAYLWGLTIPGWVLPLWPLAYANHRLLAMLARGPDPSSPG